MIKPFIVFEGVDGAGKSEVSARVAKQLNAIHLESPIGEFKKIRQYIDTSLNDTGRFLFYLASNFDLSEYVRNKREREMVICARYFHSTIIGHASRQGIKIDEFYKNLPISLEILERPNKTIFLYVNETKQRERIKSRGQENNSLTDYKCLNDMNYRKTLFENYCKIAEKEGWLYIDTSDLSIDQVVRVCVDKVLQNDFPG